MKTTILSLALLLLITFPVLSQNFDYQLKTIIGTPINLPIDVAIDNADNIYVLDNGKITRLDPDGKLLGYIPIVSVNYSLEIDQENNFYVSNRDCACVIKYDATGKVLLKFGSKGTGMGQAKSINEAALDNEGNIYYADYTNGRVLKFNAQGEFVQHIGARIADGGTLVAIRDIGVDAAGNVYILDSDGNYNSITKVHKFSPEGQILDIITAHQEGPDYNPNDVASMLIKDDGGMYIIHQFFRDVIEYDPNGNFIRKFAGHGSQQGGLIGDGLNMKLDKHGNIFVADRHYLGGSINKYSPNGYFLRKYGRDKAFMSPVYDKYNNLHVYDAKANTINVYNPKGDLKLKINPLSLDGKYLELGHLALSGWQHIFTAVRIYFPYPEI